MNEAYESIKEIEDSFSTVVNKISVEMIGENEESIIIIEKELNRKLILAIKIVVSKPVEIIGSLPVAFS